MSSAPDAAFSAMGRESFVSLGTFRRSGAVVATPVWLVADGDDLLVHTQAGSGKVKRLRHGRCSGRSTGDSTGSSC